MTGTINLSGKWELNYTEHNANTPKTWKYTAQVPGDVNLEMQKYKKLPDPYFGDNFKKYRWIEDKDWWYSKEFSVPPDLKKYAKLVLKFHGVDTIATYWLNNRKLGGSDNMFIPVEFDVTNKVIYGAKNRLTVKIHSTIKEVRKSKYKNKIEQTFYKNERLYIRKPSYNFGWDIAPRLLSAGMHRPVEIKGINGVYIENIYIRTVSVSKTRAVINAEITVKNNCSKKQAVNISLLIKGTTVKKQSLKTVQPGISRLKYRLIIKNPKLWWPNGHGKPVLYSLETTLLSGGAVFDRNKTNFGIKTVKLVRKKQDDGGTSFYFVINGRKIFIAGTNWVPLEALPAKVTTDRIKKVIKLIKGQNLNCMRIWGGGYYEEDLVYDLCDKHGILVWHDFMFACGMYPQDRKFSQNVKREAEYIIKHLRNHPSMLIWSGDNENEMVYFFRKVNYRKVNRISRVVLKNACLKLAPGLPFIPSSPYSETNTNPFYPKEGDNHLYRHGTHYRDKVFSQDVSRFLSEIGHLSIPDTVSIKKFLPKKCLWPAENKTWHEHFGSQYSFNMHPNRSGRILMAINNVFGYKPDNLEEFSKLSQKVQSDALVFWIKHSMENKYCGGIIYWNMIDCWPQFSDAVVDYYFRKKLAYNEIKKLLSKQKTFG